MRRKTLTVVFSVLAALGCDDGDDDDRDSGPTVMDGGRRDGGPRDSGSGTDSGTDAGGDDDVVYPRFVNNIPGIPAMELCLHTAPGGTIVGAPRRLTMTNLIPFRGVSSYFPEGIPVADGLSYVVAGYAVTGARDPAFACPANPNAATPAPALLATVDTSDLDAGERYTLIATGFARGTFGAEADALPALCQANGAGEPVTCPDTLAARIVVVEDDQTAPASAQARVRVSHQVANAPPVLICYDQDITPAADPTRRAQGLCDHAGVNAPVALNATPVTYGQVSDYTERAPIEPTIPVAGAGGGLYLTPIDPRNGTPSCLDFGSLPAAMQRCYPILAATPADPPLPPNVQFNLSAGDISTIFVYGVAESSPPGSAEYEVPAAYKAGFILWQDNLVE